jgi:predicted hydrocarbon binding protein
MSVFSPTDEGWLLDAYGNRMIAFQVETFQAFVNRLMEVAGKQVGTVLLYAMGWGTGRFLAKNHMPKSSSEEDLRSAFDSTLRSRGWGCCLKAVKHTSEPTYTFTIAGTPLSHNRKSDKPTCHMIRGVVAGWLEEFSGKMHLDCKEVECVSMGAEACKFELQLSK